MSDSSIVPFDSNSVVAGMLRCQDFAELPHAERMRVRAWVAGLSAIVEPGVTAQLRALADRMGVSYGTARRYRSEWGGDWRNIADSRKVQGADVSRARSRDFVQFFKKLCEKNQRCTSAAIRELRRRWADHEPVPGYEGWPGWPKVPPGWSDRNLSRLAPTQGELKVMRQGIRAARSFLPQTLRTRVGLWPGSHIQFDDVWHDNFVRWGDEVTRVLEFGALDVWSGCRFAWGSKPRMKKEGGGHAGLSEKEFRFFVAGVLWSYGYSERGTVMMGEHGTAYLTDQLAALLSDATGGALQFDSGGLSGEQQAVLGLWGGNAGGSGNFKSHLECLHALIHTEVGALPGQTGKDRQSAPEATYGMVRYQERLLRWVKSLPPEIAEKVRHPLLDYHTQFLPLRDFIYGRSINGRTEHKLEGWAALDRLITEYRMGPESREWMDLDALPESTRAIVLSATREEPKKWSRVRKLSPGEVWENRSGMIPITQAMVADILGPDLGREVKVRGSYFRFEDCDISPEELIYEARVSDMDGRSRELPDGEKCNCLVNPYAPECLLVLDARGRCLGVARRAQRVCLADADGMVEQWGRNATRQVERLAELRERWEPEEGQVREMRDHNAALGFGGVRGRRDGGERERNWMERQEEKRAQRVVERALEEVPVSDEEDEDDDCPFI